MCCTTDYMVSEKKNKSDPVQVNYFYISTGVLKYIQPN